MGFNVIYDIHNLTVDSLLLLVRLNTRYFSRAADTGELSQRHHGTTTMRVVLELSASGERFIRSGAKQ